MVVVVDPGMEDVVMERRRRGTARSSPEQAVSTAAIRTRSEQDQRSTGAQGAHSVVEASPRIGATPWFGAQMLASNGCSL